jgi:hypothetical protein
MEVSYGDLGSRRRCRLPAHVETYRSFVHGVQMAVIVAAVVLALLAFFLL